MAAPRASGEQGVELGVEELRLAELADLAHRIRLPFIVAPSPRAAA